MDKLDFVDFKKGNRTWAVVIGTVNDMLDVVEEHYGEPNLALLVLEYLGRRRGKNVEDWEETIEELIGEPVNYSLTDEVKGFIPSGTYDSCNEILNVYFYVEGIEYNPEYTEEELIKAIKKDNEENA